MAKNNKLRFFYGLYSDKPWVFDQSERAQGPIYIKKRKITHKVVINVVKLFTSNN